MPKQILIVDHEMFQYLIGRPTTCSALVKEAYRSSVNSSDETIAFLPQVNERDIREVQDTRETSEYWGGGTT